MRSDRRMVLLASTAVVLVVLAGAAAGVQAHQGRPAAEAREQVTTQEQAYAPQSSTGRISLTVAPRWERGQLVFALGVNTHSGDLSTIDLGQTLRLRVAGRVLAPTRVGSLAGHHARTEAAFALPSRPAAFQLELRGIPDVPVRTLSWPQAAPRGRWAPGSRAAARGRGAAAPAPLTPS